LNTTATTFLERASGAVADALKYWEPRRILYNAVLLLVVLGHVIAEWPASKIALSGNLLLGFFILAVVANICYCAVYGVDLFVQASGLGAALAMSRMVVLIVGTTFAAVITHFVVSGSFTVSP